MVGRKLYCEQAQTERPSINMGPSNNSVSLLTPEQLEDALFKEHDILEPKAVAVFDFDGTLVSPYDHYIYEAPYNRALEEQPLQTLASSLNLRYNGVGPDEASHEREARYLRHVAHQTVLYLADDDIELGPLFDTAKRVQRANGEWYVLTSRSSPSAVRRLFDFLHQHDLKPNQVFCVGRISKHLQIDHLLDLYPRSRIYFADDLVSELDKVAKNVSEPDRVAFCHAQAEPDARSWTEDNTISKFYDEMNSKMAEATNEHRFSEQALVHATTLYVYHAQQRLHGFRYFISATGLAVAAYAAAFHQEAFEFSIAMASFGILISIVFLLLDNRNRQLVECDEKPMIVQQARLAEQTDDQNVKIIAASDGSEKSNLFSARLAYGTILPGTFILVGLVWIIALIFSVYFSLPSPIG